MILTLNFLYLHMEFCEICDMLPSNCMCERQNTEPRKLRGYNQFLTEIRNNRSRYVKELMHITHITNLKSIFSHGILPRASLLQSNWKFKDVSEARVQRHRRKYTNYVPTFFADNPPMLYIIEHNNQNRENWGIDNIVKLFIPIEMLIYAKKFSNGNIANSDCQLFTDLRRLDELKWDIIKYREAWSKEYKFYKSAEALFDIIRPEWISRISYTGKDKLINWLKNIKKAYPQIRFEIDSNNTNIF